MIIRPMRGTDLAAVGSLASRLVTGGTAAETTDRRHGSGSGAAAARTAGGGTGSAGATAASTDTGPETRPAALGVRHRAELVSHLLEHEPDGCWVAEADGRPVGFVQAGRGEKFWTLAHLVVAPEYRRSGTGAALLDAALSTSQGCLYGAAASPIGTGGARMLRAAGFNLYPTLRAHGQVMAANLPVVDGVRVGAPADRDLADSVDRQIRGAAHGAGHELLARTYPLFVCDLLTGSGYCYVDETGSPVVLAATNRKIAQRLLWSALMAGRDNAAVRIDHLSAGQEWAIDVAMAAGLHLEPGGYVALRYIRPPTPYLPASDLF